MTLYLPLRATNLPTTLQYHPPSTPHPGDVPGLPSDGGVGAAGLPLLLPPYGPGLQALLAQGWGAGEVTITLEPEAIAQARCPLMLIQPILCYSNSCHPIHWPYVILTPLT